MHLMLFVAEIDLEFFSNKWKENLDVLYLFKVVLMTKTFFLPLSLFRQ